MTTTRDGWRRAPSWIWDASGLALIAGLRIALLVASRTDPVFRVPYLDSAFYHTWGRSLALGQGDFQGAYFLGPLYPHFLALLYRIASPDPWIVRCVQTSFGILDAALVLAVGRRLFGAGAARAAVLLFGLYGPLAFYENLLVMESLLVTLTLAALFVLLVPRWNTVWRGLAAGGLLGLASLGRPTVLAAMPVAFWALWRMKPIADGRRAPQRNKHPVRADPLRSRPRWRSLLACVAGCLVVLAPVLVRNFRQGGVLAISTNGGVNLFAGNNERANGRFHEPPGVRFFSDPLFESAGSTSLPPAIAARALTVRAVAGTESAADSRLWRRRALSWMVAHPAAALGLFAHKVWLVLQAREVPQIESYSYHAHRIGALRLFIVDFGWLWPLAILGAWRARRERVQRTAEVALFGIAMLVPCLVFFVTSRYRLAAVPEASLFAGFGAATLVRFLRRREFRNAALALAVMSPVALLSHLGAAPPRGSAGWENAQMAERLYAIGDLEGAIRLQEKAAAELPNRYEPALGLALYWSERGAPGDLDRAIAQLEQLAQRWPREAVVQFNLGVLLEQAGRIEEARRAWERALAADPRFEPARSRLLATQSGRSSTQP